MINHVTLIGYIGGSMKEGKTTNNTSIASFSLATSEKYMKKDGTKEEKTEWHKIIIYGKAADFALEHYKKGMLLFVDGKIHYNKWEKDGKTNYTTEIVASLTRILKDAKGELELPSGRKYTEANDIPEENLPF